MHKKHVRRIRAPWFDALDALLVAASPRTVLSGPICPLLVVARVQIRETAKIDLPDELDSAEVEEIKERVENAIDA